MTSITTLAPFVGKTIVTVYDQKASTRWVFGSYGPGYHVGITRDISFRISGYKTDLVIPDFPNPAKQPLILAFYVVPYQAPFWRYKLTAYDADGKYIDSANMRADQMYTETAFPNSTPAPILGDFINKYPSTGKYHKICVYDGDITTEANMVSLFQSLFTTGVNTYTGSTYTFTAPVGFRSITLALGSTTSTVNNPTSTYLSITNGTGAFEYDSTKYTAFSTYGDLVAPAPSYTLAFNSQGGSLSPSSVTGSTATLPSPGTKASNTFNGWWTSASGAGTLAGAAGASYAIAANGTLHARWELTATLGVGATAALSSTPVGTPVTYTYDSQLNYAKTIPVSTGSVTYASPGASYPSVTVSSISHMAGSVTHMAVEMSPVVVTAGVPMFSIVITAYSGGVLPGNIMDGGGFTGTLVMNIPGVTGDSIALQSRPDHGSGSYTPIGTADRIPGTDNFSIELPHLSQITPVPPSSGSGAGDPYVSTIAGKIYKLPAFNGALRLYQGFAAGKLLTVNATTKIDDDKEAMDADNRKMNSKLMSPVAHSLEMTEAMSFFDKIHVQLGDAHAVFSVYDGFRQLSPLPAGWALHDKGTVADYLSGLPFYAHLAGSVHELRPCEGVTIRMGIVPIRHIRSTVEVAAPNMTEGSGALVHRLSRKQMTLRKLADIAPIRSKQDAPVRRTLREAFVCDRATTHAEIAFLG